MTTTHLDFVASEINQKGFQRIENLRKWALDELDFHEDASFYNGLQKRLSDDQSKVFFMQDALIREIVIALIVIEKMKRLKFRGAEMVIEVLTGWLNILAEDGADTINWEAVSYYRNFVTRNTDLYYTELPSLTMSLFRFLYCYSYPNSYKDAVLEEIMKYGDRYFGDFAIENKTDDLLHLVKMLEFCPFKERHEDY